MQKINPFLWFDTRAEEAANYYVSVFSSISGKNSGSKDSVIDVVSRYGEAGPGKKGSVMIVTFHLLGQEFIALNGGPVKDFTFNASLSFFINCDSLDEINTLWTKLSDGGKVLMEFKKYPFSEKYGWLQDKFGISWQLNLSPGSQKIALLLMFVRELNGKAQEAINYYTSIFRNSGVTRVARFGPGEGGTEGAIKHSVFTLNGQNFMAMDGGKDHAFNFTPAISLFVNCDTQEEVNDLWEKLSDGGEKSQCGWLKDKYGISWQIVPTILGKLMSDPDTKKSQSVMKAMLKMTKIEIADLQYAYDHSS